MKIVCSWCRQEGKAELVGRRHLSMMLGKRMGFASFTAMKSRPAGRRFIPPRTLDFRPDCILRFFAGPAC